MWLKLWMAIAIKAYQELREVYGHDHAEALRLALDTTLRSAQEGIDA
jgi:hypothetical protein